MLSMFMSGNHKCLPERPKCPPSKNNRIIHHRLDGKHRTTVFMGCCGPPKQKTYSAREREEGIAGLTPWAKAAKMS